MNHIIQIKKIGQSLQWLEVGGGSNIWNQFPKGINTGQQIRTYFADGKHMPFTGVMWPEVQLRMTDNYGKDVTHFAVTRSNDQWNAVADFDQNKTITFTDEQLWSEAERLRWLRRNAVDLPLEINDLAEALEYLQREAFTVADYHDEMQVTAKEKITTHLTQQSQHPVDVEF